MKNYRLISTILATIITGLIFGLIYFVGFNYEETTSSDYNFILQVVFLILFSVVWKFFYRYFCKIFSKNQPRSQYKIQNILDQNNDFVLFLRPFKHDELLEEYTENDYDPFIGLTTDYLTVEEQVANSFADFGMRTVAIADNKEINTYLGYERYLADNDTWKATVTTLIEKSKFICLYGNGEGEFQWELAQITNLHYLKKCIIFYPGNKSGLEPFYKSYHSLEINLPELISDQIPFFESTVFGGIVYYNKSLGKFDSFSFKKVKSRFRSKKDIWPKLNTFLKNALEIELTALKQPALQIHLFSFLADILSLVLFYVLCYGIIWELQDYELTDDIGYILILLFIAPGFLYLIFGLVPSNIIFKLQTRDKSGCRASFNQKVANKVIVCLSLIWIFFFIYFLVLIIVSIIKKRLYLPQAEFSGTALFVKKKK